MSRPSRPPATVVVLGSLNLDVVCSVPAIPAPGETVLADGREDQPGGKGLNQAVAAARAGASTQLVGAVGDDEAGRILVAAAADSGVDTSGVRRVDGPSGTALIMVRADGENAIVVDGAANRQLTGLTPDERSRVEAAGVLVMPLETPLATVVEAAGVAHRAGRTVVLNAAPAQALPDELLGLVDVLVVNETEARQLSGAADTEAAARALLTRTGAVVVTLGAAGALVATRQRTDHLPGHPAEVVDTTGAGDTFTGVLAAGLADGASLDRAAGRAVVAGALAVEKAGAVPSIPTATQIEERLNR